MNVAIILAAGVGSRINSKIPKQFIEIAGKPLLYYSVLAFEKNQNIDKIVLVAEQSRFEEITEFLFLYNFKKVEYIIGGGTTRQESSYNAINGLKDVLQPDDCVLIHDGARPLVTSRIIDENISALKTANAVVTAIVCEDTPLKVKNNQITEALDRNDMYFAQTPQSFRYGLIQNAHNIAKEKNLNNLSDDSQLFLTNGQEVTIVNGDKVNFKVTLDFDLKTLKNLLSCQK